jgi:hypothetical protein
MGVKHIYKWNNHRSNNKIRVHIVLCDFSRKKTDNAITENRYRKSVIEKLKLIPFLSLKIVAQIAVNKRGGEESFYWIPHFLVIFTNMKITKATMIKVIRATRKPPTPNS